MSKQEELVGLSYTLMAIVHISRCYKCFGLPLEESKKELVEIRKMGEEITRIHPPPHPFYHLYTRGKVIDNTYDSTLNMYIDSTPGFKYL